MAAENDPANVERLRPRARVIPPPPPDGGGDEDDGNEDDGGGPSPVVILGVVLLLVVGGWFLAHKLSELSRIQDCVISGRHNCAPIEDGK